MDIVYFGFTAVRELLKEGNIIESLVAGVPMAESIKSTQVFYKAPEYDDYAP